MLHTPPKHTIEAAAGLTSVYILPGDNAWDQDRITREIAENFDGKAEAHPVAQYLNGNTRYDLDADALVAGERVTIRTYLIGRATEFRIRRLSTIDIARVNGWMHERADNINLAMDYACRRGIVSIENLDIDWIVRDGELSDVTMQQLYDCGTSDEGGGGIPLITDIGLAIFRVSQPLTYGEKKASGY